LFTIIVYQQRYFFRIYYQELVVLYIVMFITLPFNWQPGQEC